MPAASSLPAVSLAAPITASLAALSVLAISALPASAEPAASFPQAERLTVVCGEVGLLFRSSSQWTPGRIDYRGTPLSTERSAYGTVFRLPGLGFIGTGHLEVEPEDLREAAFFVDGERPDPDADTLEAGEVFHFRRVSRIRDLDLENTIAIHGDRLFETTTVSARADTPLELVYHFMHAWIPSVGSYLAGVEGEGIVDEGTFPDTEEATRKFHVTAPVDWVAVHDPESDRFAVSRLLAYPEAAGQDSQIWNVPGTYRKYYLTSFRNATVPAGFTGTWAMVTGFGEASPSEWRAAAETLAGSLAGAAAPPFPGAAEAP